MNPYRFPVAILGVVGIAAIAPTFMHFVNEYGAELPTQDHWLAMFILPALVLLFLGSWLGGDIR